MKEFLIEHCLGKTGKVVALKSKYSWWSLHEFDEEWSKLHELTKSMNKDSSFSDRVWFIINEIKEIGRCLKCSSTTKFSQGKYNLYCSKQCALTSTESDVKRKQTMLSRYGAENAYASNAIKSKIKNVLIEKYGVENISQSQEIKNKKEATCLERLGVANPFQSESVKSKIKTVNLERYGVEYVSQDENVKQLKRETSLLRYGKLHHLQNQNILQKQKDTCLEKYGYEWASQVPHFIEKRSKSLQKKYYTVEQLEHLSEEGLAKLHNRHISEKTPVYALSEELGIGKHTLSTKFVQAGLASKLFNTSFPHINLANKFQEEETINNDREVLEGKEIDILFPAHNLGVEIDGIYWHSFADDNKRRVQIEKIKDAMSKGVRLIRFTDIELELQNDICISIIKNYLKRNVKVYARKCKIIKLNNQVKRKFFDENHLQGDCRSAVCYALEYNNEVVQALSFGKSRFSNKYQWEIIRSASAKNITVVGGLNKLFEAFKIENSPNSVISYCDLRYFTGEGYAKIGFDFAYDTDVGYYYWKSGLKLENRLKFQKHKLSGILGNYDPNKSEKQNMLDNGYRIYYDCGQRVFVWKNST